MIRTEFVYSSTGRNRKKVASPTLPGTPANGGTYIVHHERKGVFSLCVIRSDGEFITGTIIGNKAAGAMLPENVMLPGEKITIRKTLCTLTKIEIK